MSSVAGQLIGLIAVLTYSGVGVESSSSPPSEVENGSEFTDLPPRVGLTLEQIRSTHGYHPACLRDNYPTELVLQAYYVHPQHYVGCVVAWVGDTQTSALISHTSLDVFKLFVKRTNPVVTVVNWHALGEEVWDGIVPVDFDRQTLSRFSMVLDRSGYPIIAWAHPAYSLINRYILRVRRWDGQSWVNMGGVLNLESRESAYKPLLEFEEDDNLIVSWTEADVRHRAQWTGERWVLQ
jgi:hypothetical protein